jgi:cytosine/adenosine deaminase-related metal-dependent hydrolase
MPKTTHIRNSAWAIVWDADAGRQRYLRDTDIVFSDATITHVGQGYDGVADEVIDGSNLLAMPGLVNIHCHSRSGPIGKGIIEELGTPEFYMSGLYDTKAVFWKGSAVPGDTATAAASAKMTYAELLLSGTTTVVDLSIPYPEWIDLLAASGLRGVVGPWYASAEWATDNGHEVRYIWDVQAGRRHFDAALACIKAAERHPVGRLSGILAPDTLDTIDLDLLGDTIEVARAGGQRLTIHCGESMVEFNEFTRRHGCTPVQYAAKHGVLGPHTILGHCIFIDEHSWPHWWSRRDLSLLADASVCVAHCPTPFSRYGVTMENLPRYLRAGINIGLGTDTFPHNLLEEMRLALTLARVACEDMTAISTSDVFHAATIGGAQALGRGDIGRIAEGAKADIVLVDLTHDAMRPLRDPLRSLVYSAAERAVRDVFVDGRKVVAGHRVLTIDTAEAAAILEEAQRRAEKSVSSLDWAHRGAREISPLTLEMTTIARS